MYEMYDICFFSRCREAVQPFGPRGADLLLHCTEAATALGLRRPELLKDKDRRSRKKKTKKKEENILI